MRLLLVEAEQLLRLPLQAGGAVRGGGLNDRSEGQRGQQREEPGVAHDSVVSAHTCCRMAEIMRIMIGALSCWKYKERRERCEQTWMQEGDKLNGASPGEHTITRSVFLIGSPGLDAPALAGRCLLLPGPS